MSKNISLSEIKEFWPEKAPDINIVQKYVKKKLRLRRKLEEDASDALGVALCHGITLTDTPDHVEPI